MKAVFINYSFKNYLASLILVLFSNSIYAQTTYTSNGSGDFRTISWTPSSPADFDNISTDNFIIRDSDAVILASDISINDLEIGQGGAGGSFTIGNDVTSRNLIIGNNLTVLNNSTLTVASNSATHAISVGGDIVHAGTTFDLAAGTDVANLTINGSATSVISGNAISFNDLTINSGNSLIITSTITVNGDFLADQAGTDIITSFNQTFTGNFTLSNSATFTATSSNQIFSGASDQSIDISGGSAVFNGLIFDNSIKTVDGNLITDGTFEITADAVWNGANDDHQIATLEVKNGSGITISDGSVTFTGGTIRFGDGFASDGTVTLGSNINVTFDGTSTIQRDDVLIVDGDVEITEAGQLIISGTDSSLPVDESDSELQVTGTRTLTVRNNGDLYMRGYDNFPTGFSTYVLETRSLVRYDADFDQIIAGENDANVTIEHGRLYLSQPDASPQRQRTLFTGDDDLLVSGQMNLVNGIHFNVSHTANVTLNEDLFVDSGTGAGDPSFTASNTTLTLDANQNQLIDGPLSGNYILSQLIITNTGIPTDVKNVNIDNGISINNTFSVQNPNGDEANTLIVDLDENQIFGGNGTGENFILGAYTVIYTSSNDIEGFAEDFGDGGDVISIDSNSILRFDRNGDQTIPNFNGGTFGSIQFAGSGNRYIPSAGFSAVPLIINGDVTRISGTPVFRFGSLADAFQVDVSHSVAGDWNLAAAYTGDDETNGGTTNPLINFNGTDQIISASDFGDVQFSGSGTKTITGTLLIDGDLTIDAGVTVNAGSEAIDIAGNWTENSGAIFVQEGSVTDFNGGTTQSIVTQSGSYFNYVDITNNSTFDIGSTVQINGDLDIEDGSVVAMNGQTLSIGRDLWVRDSGTITYSDPSTSVILFDGDTEQDIRNINASQNFPTVEFVGVGNKALINNIMTIEGNLTIASESTFDGGGFEINFEGDTWSNLGNFTHNNDVNFLNSGGTTTVSTSTFHDIEIGSSDGSVFTTVLLAGNISLDGEMNIFANTTLDVSGSNYSISVEEDWNNYGIFNAQEGNVTFVGNSSDFRSFSATANSGIQTDKAFYDLTVNLSQGQFFNVQEEGATLNDQIDILNNLNITSGNFRLQEADEGIDPGPALMNIGGDFIIDGGFISYRQENASITMNGTSGTHSINLGGNEVRDFEINATGATYQLINDFVVRNDADNEFILTSGTLDLNGNILTINRGGIEMSGGTLLVDEGASLLLNDLAVDPDFNKTGGNLEIIGLDEMPATLSAVDAGGFTFNQNGGDIQAQYYTIANTTGDGLRIEGGTIDVGTTGNNFSNGTFTSGSGTAYLTLANIPIGTQSASNVVFNAGPTNNVAVDAGNLPASGSIEFVISGGSIAGAQDELDVPDGGDTDGYIRWNEDPGFRWTGGSSTTWNEAANWTDDSGDADGIPDADDIIYIEAGSSFDPIIGAGESYTVARITVRSGGSITMEGDGELSVDGNITIFSGSTIDMTNDASSLINIAGAWANAGTFNEGSATVNFNGTSGTHSITTMGNGDPFYNLTINGDGATYTLGSILTVSNAFMLSDGTFDASSGFDIFINNDWTVNGGIYTPGQNRVRFNGTSGTQSISGGTMWDARFEGAAAKSIDGNISIADDIVIVDASGLIAANDRTIFIGGNWDLDNTNGFTPGTGTVIFNGTATQDIENDDSHELTFNNVIFQNNGIKNLLHDVTVNGDFSIISENTNVDMEFGVTVTITGTLSQTGGTFRIYDSNFPTAGAYSLTGGEVEFRNDGSQTIPGNITYNDIEIRDNNGGTSSTTLLGDITVNDDLVVSTGISTLDIDGYTITLNDQFSITNDDDIIWNGGTLIHVGPNWTIDPDFNTTDRPFNNLILRGTGLKRPQSNIAVNGNLTVGDNVELDQLTQVIVNDGGDTFTMEPNSLLDNRVVGLGIPSGFANYILDPTSTVVMQASGDQTIFTNSGTLNYGNLNLSTIGDATLDGQLNVSGDFDMNGNPTLVDSNFDLNLGGSFIDLQDYSPSPTTTVTFNRDGDQLIVDNDGTGQNLEFANVIFDGSGLKTLNPNTVDEVTDIDGTVVINSGVSVTSSRGVNFGGTSWINNGTFATTITTRPFVFDGGNTTIDPGNNTIAGLNVSNSIGTVVTVQNNGFNLGIGDMNIDADATIDFSNLTHYIGSENVNNTGNWILTDATLDFNQNGGQNIPIIDEGTSNVTGIPSIVLSTNGTKLLTGSIVIDNLTIGANTNLDVDATNSYQITVNGNWTNNGGDLFSRDGTVLFYSDNSDAKTIMPNGEPFSVVTFQGSSIRNYSLLGDMAIYGHSTTGTCLTLESATLDLNGNILSLGNNDTGNPDAETNIIGLDGTLEIDEGAILEFSTSDEGNDVLGTEIGGNLDVQNGGRLSIVGLSSSVATVTRFEGGNRIDINIESGGEIDAFHYSMQYLTDEGLEVEDGAIIDPDANGYNFSNGIFSNLDTDTGAGDDNPINGNRYLTIESDAALIIDNVVFNFGGTPTIGQHYNVTRSNAGGNLVLDFNNTSGPLGRSGSIYEDDGDPTTPAEANGLLTWDLPDDTRWTGAVSIDWTNAANWDNGVPSIASNDREAIIDLGSPFNPSIDGISVNVSALIINDGILKIVNSSTLDLDGDMTLGDGTGGALIMDASSMLEIEGSWTSSANIIFDNGEGTVSFDAPGGNAVSISPGDQSFHNLTFTNGATAGEFNIVGATLDINGNLTLENSANLVPATTGYDFTIAGNIIATGSSFDTSVDGLVILDGANQTITDISFDELTVAGTGTKTTSGTMEINDILIISEDATLSGGGAITFNDDVYIYGTFNGVTGQTYTFKGGDWFAEGSSYTGEGTVVFDRASGTQYFRQLTSGDNPIEFHNLTLSGSAAMRLGLLNGGDQEDGNIDLTGDMIINNTISTIDLEDYQIDNTSGTGTFTLAADEFMTVRGASNFPSGFAVYDLHEDSYTRYYGTIDQVIAGNVTYGRLQLQNSTTKVLGGNIDVDGDLTFQNATLDVSVNNYSINAANRWDTNNGNDDGAFIARSGTVTFDGDNNQTLDIGETGTQSFNDVFVNKAGGNVELGTSNLTINGNLSVVSGTFDINSLTASIGGNMNASGSGAFASSNTGLYYLNASSGTPTVSGNGSTILGSIEIDAPGRNYELIDNLSLLGSFTINAGTFDINGQQLSVGDSEDAVSISGTLNVSTTSRPGGTLALGSDVQLVVQPGGSISIVGTDSQPATVTSTATTDYFFSVTGTGGNPGNIAARFYLIEYIGVDGIYVNTNTTIDATNNFSDGTFQNGFAGGRYLRIENDQDLTGANRIENIVFDDNPGGGATNVNKATAISGAIELFNYTGGFSGENFDNDPNDLITWLAPPTVTWTGIVSSDWFDEDNWDSGTIPLATQDVIIPQTLNEPVITDNVNIAECQNLTIEINAIVKTNTTDVDAVDLQINGNLVFEASARFESEGSDDAIEVAGGWLRESNALFMSGTSHITFNSVSGIETIDANDSFYDLTINIAGTINLANDLTVNNDFNVNAGTFDLTSFDLIVGENFSNTGTINANTQTIYLIPNSTITPKSFDSGSSELYSLTIGELAGDNVEYDLLNDLTVNHDFNLILGTLDPNTNDLYLGDSDANQDDINISGTILVEANETMALGDDAVLLVNSGGDVRFNGTDASNVATMTRRTTGSYDFTVESGGTFEASFFNFEHMANEGIWLQSSATLVSLSDGIFNNGDAATQYLRLSNSFASDVTASDLTFSVGPTYNVRRNEAAGNNVILLDAAGTLAGPTFELDDGFATTGEVQWTYTNTVTVWTGAFDTDWSNILNWNSTIPTDAHTVQIPDVSLGSNTYPIIDNTSGDADAASLTIFSGATLTINDDRTLTTVEDFSNSGTFTISGNSSVIVGSAWTNNGVFNPGTSTVTLTSANNVTLTGGLSFYNLELDGDGTGAGIVFSSSESLDVNNHFTITDGVYEITDASHTLSIGGDFIVDDTNGSFADNLSTTTFDGINQNIGSSLQSASISFNNLVLSGSGDKTLEDDISILSDFTVNTGVSFILGDRSVSFAGDNFDIDGNLDVSTGNSTITFNGSQTQIITGNSGSLDFDNFVVNNTALGNNDIQLTVDLNINNNVDFETGIIQSSASNPLQFNDGSTVSFDGVEETSPISFPGTDVDGNSYTVGPVLKVGADDFIFPIGEGTRIGRIGISSISGGTVADEYSAEYFFAQPTNFDDTKNGGIQRVSSLEYWDLSNNNGHSGQPLVTLFWDATSQVTDLPTLTIAHYNGSTWDNEGNGSTTGAASSGTITSANSFDSFSPITLATTNDNTNPLPVDLLDFDAELLDEKVELTWSTASETNNDYFILERSLDGETFEQIKTVSGQGTINEQTDYSYIDDQPYIGKSFYRLTQVDFDGMYTVFDMISININIANQEFNALLIPNPTIFNKVTLRLTSTNERNNTLISMYGLTGKIVLTEAFDTHLGTQDISLDLTGIPSGIYHVKIEHEGKLEVTKLIIR